MKTIVKWAGGKSGLLPLIRQKMELISTKEATLYDLFGGGGSVSFAFVDSFKHVVLNDTNEELINLYNVVREKPNELMKELDAHQKKHSTDYYYTIRQMDRDSSYSTKTELYRAARMLYLNKTCYNGLYRVNTKGQFNVPIGRQKTVRLYNREQIMNIHEKLERITLENKDYNEVLESCKKGDLVYIDPPYDRINAQSFIEYNGQRFDSEDQKRLADKVDMLTNKGVYVIFSNSATENIKALYKKYLDDTSIIKARRNIAANGTSRKEIDEVLGDNFWGVKRVNKDLKNVDIIKHKMWSFFYEKYITIFKYKGVLYRLFDDNKYQVFLETEKLETDIEPCYRYCHFKMNDIIYESVFTTDIMIFVERKQKRRRTLFDLED